MNKKLRRQLENLCDGAVLFDEPLARWTSFRVGGPADALVRPRTLDSLRQVLAFVRQEDIPYFVVGRGTNLVVKDGGFRGVVISLKTGFKKTTVQEAKGMNYVLVTAEGGISLPQLVRCTAEAGFSGLEFAAGIPGSVGGAIYMNAGSWGGEIKDCLQGIIGLDRGGKIRQWDRGQLSFDYRSLLSPKVSVILSGTFCLERNNPTQVQDMVSANLARKRATQPLRQPSAGSVFRNPPGMAAGKLIDMAGLKGARCGGARVSQKHTNFIVNTGKATSSDILNLLGLVRERVYACFGVKLESEVEIVGADL